MVCRGDHYRTYKLIDLIRECVGYDDEDVIFFLDKCYEQEPDPRSNHLYCIEKLWPDLNKGKQVDFKSEGIIRLEKFKKFVKFIEEQEYSFTDFYLSM